MFSADIQPPCASRSMLHPVHHHLSTGTAEALVRSVFYKRMRGRQNQPTWSVFFWTGRIFFARNLPGFLFPLPYHQKYWAKKYVFFHSTQKSHGNPGILLDLSYGLGISLFFLCVCPKIAGILGITEKNPSMPKNKAGGVLKCFL